MILCGIFLPEELHDIRVHPNLNKNYEIVVQAKTIFLMLCVII